MATFSVRSTRPETASGSALGKRKGKGYACRADLVHAWHQVRECPNRGGGEEGEGGRGGGVMGCGNDEASRSVLKGLLYPRYGKDERLFSKGTVIGGRKKNRNG